MRHQYHRDLVVFIAMVAGCAGILIGAVLHSMYSPACPRQVSAPVVVPPVPVVVTPPVVEKPVPIPVPAPVVVTRIHHKAKPKATPPVVATRPPVKAPVVSPPVTPVPSRIERVEHKIEKKIDTVWDRYVTHGTPTTVDSHRGGYESP